MHLLTITGVVLQVRQKRQDRYHEARMRKAKAQQTAQEKQELERDINLVRETPFTEEEEERAPMEVSSAFATLFTLPSVYTPGSWLGLPLDLSHFTGFPDPGKLP